MPADDVRIIPLIDPAPYASSRRLAWLATSSAGVPVGSAFLRLFTDAGQAHLGELELTVHPTELRAGVGTQLLDAVVTAARSDGRRSIITQARSRSEAESFLCARQFRRVLRLTYARLDLTAAEPVDLQAVIDTEHPGYRLESWDGVVPDALAETFAASRVAMDDMPMDETDYGTVEWDVERVRSVAQAVAGRGDLLHTVAAIDTLTGSIVGFTELVVSGARDGQGTGDGQYYGTGVLPPHRGRGLARWMKALSITQARQRHPQLSALLTDTAESNLPMRAVNDRLGFAATHQVLEFQLDL